jgi:glycerol-3-phosphate dehydrogenase
MLEPREALELEPTLNHEIIAAFLVKDAAVNPFRLSLDNIAQAEAHGMRLLTHTEVIHFEQSGSRIRAVRLRQNPSGQEIVVGVDQVVNAAGPWAGEVAALAGVSIPIVYSKGTLLVTQTRATQSVINRLRPPDDGDIVSPSGTVSLVGTTSVELDSPSPCHPTIAEVDLLVAQVAEMVPLLADTRYIRAFAGVRPLLAAEKTTDGRALSRGFEVLSHDAAGLSNFVTVTGGKLTTFRLMAEKAADLVCSRLGVTAPCRTQTAPLPATGANQWTEPGLAPRIWLKQENPRDALLCECEMVPQSAVDQIIDQLSAKGEPLDLSAIGLRTRVGRGSCQGAFCGLRMTAHLYERRLLESERGLIQLKRFLERRWHGLRPVLWGPQLAQEELQEAIHCGLFSLEM